MISVPVCEPHPATVRHRAEDWVGLESEIRRQLGESRNELLEPPEVGVKYFRPRPARFLIKF